MLKKTINIILLILFVLVGFTPILYAFTPAQVKLLLFVALLASCISVAGFKSLFQNEIKLCRWWIIFLSWQMLLSFIGYSDLIFNNYLARVPIYGIPFLMVYVSNRYTIGERNIILAASLIILLTNIGQNVYLGITDPEIFEYLKLYKSQGVLLPTNAGDTDFTNTCLFVSCASIILLFNSEQQTVRLLSLVLVVGAVYFMVAVNSRGIAFILLLFFLIGYRLSDKIFKNLFNSLIIILLTIVILNFLKDPLLDLMRNVFSFSERMTARIDEISEHASGKATMSDDGSLSARFMLSMTSLITWLSGPINFFIGIGEEHLEDASIANLLKHGIGQHSQICDLLARFGLIGGIMFYKMFNSIFGYILNSTTCNTLKEKSKLFFLVVVLMGVLNNIFSLNIILAAFFVFPLIINHLNQHKQ